MDKPYLVGGYVKLAKLWERNQFQAFRYHTDYYQKKYADSTDSELIGVYIDITGNKQTYKRAHMVRLLRDCLLGKVNLPQIQRNYASFCISCSTCLSALISLVRIILCKSTLYVIRICSVKH